VLLIVTEIAADSEEWSQFIRLSLGSVSQASQSYVLKKPPLSDDFSNSGLSEFYKAFEAPR